MSTTGTKAKQASRDAAVVAGRAGIHKVDGEQTGQADRSGKEPSGGSSQVHGGPVTKAEAARGAPSHREIQSLDLPPE
jgi:hypothetical protein